MSPLTTQEVAKIVSNSFPDLRQREFRIFNDFSHGFYRFVLPAEVLLTEEEFIEIASGIRQSEILVEKIIFQRSFGPPGGAIFPPQGR